MVLYAVYKNCNSKPVEELKLPEIVKGTPEIHPVNCSLPKGDETEEKKKNESTKEKTTEDASEQV